MRTDHQQQLNRVVVQSGAAPLRSQLRVVLGVTVALAAGLVTGCPTTVASRETGDVCGAYYDSQVAFSTKCAGVASTDARGTRAEWVRFCTALLNAPGTSTDALKDAISVCADATQRATCAEEGDDTQVCRTAIDAARGKLPKNAACSVDNQCASGDCDGVTTEKKCGVCADIAADGADCVVQVGSATTYLRCAVGFVCDTNASKKCTKRVIVAEGGTCGVAGTTCADGLKCSSPKGAQASTCTSPAKKGEACINAGDSAAIGKKCASDLNCIAGKCQDRVAIGGTCTTSSPCTSNNGTVTCADELNCVAAAKCDPTTKRCIARSLVSVGGPCATVGSYCAPSLYCTDAKICAPTATEGAACTVGPNGVVAPQCGAFMTCTDGKCVFDDPARCK
jgi:hypothetical protein